MRLRALLPLGLLALVAGCAEMRTPPAITRIPAVLAPNSPDPVRTMAAEAAAAFADAGRSLAGDPARTARAAAQVEMLLAEFERDPRWAPISPGAIFELRGARLELRAALGIRAGAGSDAVARALAAAYQALQRGDQRAAQAALDPALFEPGGAVTLARLINPGPLPQTRLGTTRAQEEVARLAEQQLGGVVGALDPNAVLINPMPGVGVRTGP